MHVKLTVGIPLLTQTEKSQGVTTRNFMAVRNGDTSNPVLALPGQDALAFTQAVIDNLQYGDKIELSMYNVDQAGNVSTESLNGSTVLTDTIAPGAPVGSFAFTLEEVADEPAPPAVEPAPSTGDEEDAASPPSGQA